MKNDFNPVAWCYDTLAWIVFGNKLKQSQQVLLEHIHPGDKILILGGGTGWMLHELLKEKEVGEIDYVEASEKMLQKTKRRIPEAYHASINFVLGEEEKIPENHKYDCVIACYFFDLFSEVRAKTIIALIVKSLKKEGRLLVADFNLSPSSPLLHKLLIKVMYLFFGAVAKVEANSLFPFRIVVKEKFLKASGIASFMNDFILSEVYFNDKK